MPVPLICFNKTMTSEERMKLLNKLLDWCQFSETSEMKAKVAVLEKIIEYAKQNLVNSARLAFMQADKEDDSVYQACEAIFRNTDLPELLFLQHTINQIDLIKSGPHPLRENVLPLAKKHKDTLMALNVHALRNMGIAIGGMSLPFRFGVGVIAGGLLAYYSQQIQNWLVTSELEYKIALKSSGRSMHRVDDAVSGAVVTMAFKGYNMASTFFSKVQARVEEEQKQPSRNLLTH